jgi:glycosyltransferase involved in cell wall biosynthesis
MSSPERMAIGLCAFNRSLRIIPTLEALAAQVRVDDDGRTRVTRIVICDNNSTDDTPDIISRFVADHPHMSLVTEPAPGKSQAIKRLFSATDEDVVLLIDDDCIPEPRWAANLLAAIDACPRAAHRKPSDAPPCARAAGWRAPGSPASAATSPPAGRTSSSASWSGTPDGSSGTSPAPA